MRKSRDPIFAPERKKHPGIITTLMLVLLIAAVVVCFNYINNSRVSLEKKSITIASLPKQAENFRILHISDLHGLHFGAGQERLSDTLQDTYCDIVVFTGDACDPEGNFDAFLALIDLFPETPFYFIPGDEDPAPLIATPHEGDSPKAPFIQAAEERGAIYLDAPVLLSGGSESLWLSPETVYSLDADSMEKTLTARLEELQKEADSPEKKAALEAVLYQQNRLLRIREARKQMLPSDSHIALSHHPLTESAMGNLVEFLKTDNESYVSTIALILSGHYVGGQWRLPLLGALKVPATSEMGKGGWLPDDTYVSGLSYSLGIAQHISPGRGVSTANGLPPMRRVNTPTVTLITLTTKLVY